MAKMLRSGGMECPPNWKCLLLRAPPRPQSSASSSEFARHTFETAHKTFRFRRVEAPPKSRASFCRCPGLPEFAATPTQSVRSWSVERTPAALSSVSTRRPFFPQRGGGPWRDFRAIRDELQQRVSILSTVCQQPTPLGGLVQHPVNNMSTTSSGPPHRRQHRRHQTTGSGT